jgi:hypothetical protein
MKVNEKGQFIGRGEETALLIIKDLFGKNAEYSIQVPFKDLLDDDWKDTVTERQDKETLDIVVKLNPENKNRIIDWNYTIVFRIQDNHHKGLHTQERDLVQKKTLEWNGCLVVDIWEHDCPNLFKEDKIKAISEIKESISFEKKLQI